MSTDGSAPMESAPQGPAATGIGSSSGTGASSGNGHATLRTFRTPHSTRSPSEFQVQGVGLAHVRNRLELLVIEVLREMVPTLPHQCHCGLCLEDVYALSLNRLPAQYIQSGGMMLDRNKGPDMGLVRRVVSGAMGQVARRPRHE